MKEMTCGECVHFEGGGQVVKKFWLYCPFKMTGVEASFTGCGEGTRKPKEKYDGWIAKDKGGYLGYWLETFGAYKEDVEAKTKKLGVDLTTLSIIKVKLVEVTD